MALSPKQLHAIFAEKKDKDKQGLPSQPSLNTSKNLFQTIPSKPIAPMKPVTTKFNKLKTYFKKI